MSHHKPTKRRVWKKQIKRFNKTVQAGKPISENLFRLIERQISRINDNRYATEFRPWFYAQSSVDSKVDYKESVIGFFREMEDYFADEGLNVEAWKKAVRERRRRV